ncbi:MAG TPA: 50S ribosomal protein L17 [Elusimicrobia bacterium]|nr:50S ribosomal protein L17 [Elusimicrobiota bacterium]
MIKTLGGRRLGRTGEHRLALMRNMAASLILHERVTTTAAKAKELRSFAEKIITKAKLGQHREVRRDLHDKTAFKKLFDVLAPRYQTRPGGYTQILRVGRRLGDNAEKSLIRLIV